MDGQPAAVYSASDRLLAEAHERPGELLDCDTQRVLRRIVVGNDALRRRRALTADAEPLASKLLAEKVLER